ncbi:MAG: helix-turn-helix domain-containing protein [Egibacteraceae bacterium]
MSSEQPPAWLWVPPAPDSHDGPGLGEILRTYRGVHEMTQGELAAFLGCDQSFVSRLETGQRAIRDVRHLRRIAERLDIPVEELVLAAGMLRPRQGSVDVRCMPPDGRGTAVGASQRQWRLVRQGLNRRRAELARVAAALYPDADRLGPTPVLAQPDWFPRAPVDLADIELVWIETDLPSTVTGAEPEARGVRPLSSGGGRYERYSRAIRDLDPPTLFENRPGYRLLDVAWEPRRGRLTFGRTTFFDMLDVCEAAAHELARVWLRQAPTSGGPAAPGWAELPFRRLIGDPFDLLRRPVLPSISTLTIRRSGTAAAFILHHRDPRRVAVAGGVLGVMPAGVFQPSSVSPLDQAHDFDLWRNVMREFSEEFLDNREHDGSGSALIDYDSCEPFRSLSQARREGKLRVSCVALGLDPLTLCGEILAVAVIDDDVFGAIFDGFVVTNSEGVAVAAGRHARAAEGIPFTEANVRRLLDAGSMVPAGAACLELAWRYRGLLLGA